MVRCDDCQFLERYSHGETHFKRKTGCYHPTHMEQSQDDDFLKEQEVPGNHLRINLHENCAEHTPRQAGPSLFRRLWAALRA